MRTIPEDLAAHLSGTATTLATCWIVRRTDGAVLGFTDHDRTLDVGGVACEPGTGFERTAATRGAGFAVGEEEVLGALASERIAEADLADGLWDGAAVEVHRVNWAAPAERILLRSATIGEVVRADGAFRAELRGPAHVLERPTGRVFGQFCDADFADARCGVSPQAWTVAAHVAETDAAGRIVVTGAAAVPARRFAKGRLTVTDGPRAGLTLAVEDHLIEAGRVILVPWRALAAALEPGTAVDLLAGCDKRFATCRDRFANSVAFRGFPHIPGRDFAFSYARGDGEDDGGVLF